MNEKQILLENAVGSTVNALLERFDDIAALYDADIDEMCSAIAEFGGDDLAGIYRESVEDNAGVDDEPDPDAVRDARIAAELEGQD